MKKNEILHHQLLVKTMVMTNVIVTGVAFHIFLSFLDVNHSFLSYTRYDITLPFLPVISYHLLSR